MFQNAVKLFDLFGFSIRIDASWLVIAALIVWSLSAGYFPQAAPDLAGPTYLALAFVAMIALFASLILHELAHALVARRYGIETQGITLFLFGGVAELGAEPDSASAEFWIAVAGPAMSLGLAGGFGVMAMASGGGLVAVLLSYLSMINLALAVFNLIPAFPLDGGRVLRAWLWHRRGNLLEATRRASATGEILAFGLMGLGLFAALSGGGIGGIWLGLIGFFVLNASRATYQRLLMQDSLKGESVANLMTPAPWTASPQMTLQEIAGQVMLAHAVSFVPVVAGGRVLGTIDTQDMRQIPRDDWPDRMGQDIMKPLDRDAVIAPTLTAEDALKRLTERSQRKLLVMEGDRLRGILSLRDLLGHIALVQELGGSGRKGQGGRAGP